MIEGTWREETKDKKGKRDGVRKSKGQGMTRLIKNSLAFIIALF